MGQPLSGTGNMVAWLEVEGSPSPSVSSCPPNKIPLLFRSLPNSDMTRDCKFNQTSLEDFNIAKRLSQFTTIRDPVTKIRYLRIQQRQPRVVQR